MSFCLLVYTLLSYRSLLFVPTRLCLLIHLGLENEFQLGSLHQANMAYLFDDCIATNGAFLYTLLDSVLRARLLVLNQVESLV